MKLLEFKNAKPDYADYVYAVLLENKEEWDYLDDYESYALPHEQQGVKFRARCEGRNEGFWSGYMTAKLGDYYTDDDILYYFTPEEKAPEVGEKWELDDMVFERVR